MAKPDTAKPDTTKPELSKQERNRLRAREIRKAREQAKRRRKLIGMVGAVGGGVIVCLLIAILVVAVRTSHSNDQASANDVNTSASGAAGTATPANLTTNGAIPIGKPDAPVRVELFVDYICPGCGEFERANAGELDRLVKAGTASVELHPMSFLDKNSMGSRYSTRAANAVVTVAERAPGSLWAFSTELFKNQPDEGTKGLSDQRIAELAGKAGVPQEVVAQFKDRLYEQWTAAASQAAVNSGLERTPTVKINGKMFDGALHTVGPLTKAIEQAAKDTK